MWNACISMAEHAATWMFSMVSIQISSWMVCEHQEADENLCVFFYRYLILPCRYEQKNNKKKRKINTNIYAAIQWHRYESIAVETEDYGYGTRTECARQRQRQHARGERTHDFEISNGTRCLIPLTLCIVISCDARLCALRIHCKCVFNTFRSQTIPLWCSTQRNLALRLFIGLTTLSSSLPSFAPLLFFFSRCLSRDFCGFLFSHWSFLGVCSFLSPARSLSLSLVLSLSRYFLNFFFDILLFFSLLSDC